MSEKDKLYDELCSVLTDYENEELHIDYLYEMLVKIQNNWDVITANED